MKKEKDTEDILEKTIKERRKLPQEIKNTIMKYILANTVMVIVITILVLVINTLFVKLKLAEFQNYLKIIQMLVCLIGIGIFEYSYRKDSFKKSVYGIEFMGFSIAVLFTQYMYVLKSRVNFLITILIIYIIYYFIKSIIIGIYIRKQFLKSNISDVKEIVKEEKKGYIDKESTKTLRERRKAMQENTKTSKRK